MRRPPRVKKWRGRKRAKRRGAEWIQARKRYGAAWARHLMPDPIPLTASGNIIAGVRPSTCDDIAADFERMLETFRTFTDGATPYHREEITR